MDLRIILAVIWGLLYGQLKADSLDFKVPKNEQDLDEFIADLKNNKIPQLSQIEDCFISANYLADIYGDVKAYWLGKTESDSTPIIQSGSKDSKIYDLNIYRNFNSLVSSAGDFEKALRSFLEEHDSLKLTESEIRNRLDEIASGNTRLADSLVRLSQQETFYLHLIENALIQIRDFNHIYSPHIQFLKSDDCKNSNVFSILAVFREDMKNRLKDVKKLKDYVLNLREKRNLLVQRSLESVREKLLTRYANLTFDNLSQVQNQFIDILKLDSLGKELITWWQDQNTKGLAGNLHLKYLEYERPLRLLRLVDSRLLSYQKKILNLERAPEQTRQFYLGKLEMMRKNLKQQLIKLEQGGWQHQVSRQILLNEKRLELADRFSPSCIVAIEIHLSSAKKTNHIHQVAKVESLYRKSVDQCSRQED